MAAGVLFRRRACRRNTAGMREDAATPPVVQRPAKDKNPEIGASAGNQFGLSGGPGAVEGFMPRIALYPGSFDPVTNGHLDVVRTPSAYATG